jgi:magnesium-transporting ATPase (P-type)
MSQGPSEENPYQIPASFAMEDGPPSFDFLQDPAVPEELGRLLLSARPWLRGVFTVGCIGLTIQTVMGLQGETSGWLVVLLTGVLVLEGMALFLLWRFMATLNTFQQSFSWREFKEVFRSQLSLWTYVGVLAASLCCIVAIGLLFAFFVKWH